MRKKNCVVFDIDGTLFDTKPGIIKAINYVLGVFGRDLIPAEKENEFIGPPVRKSFIDLCGFSAAEAEKATALYRQIYVDKFISESIPYDGLDEVLGCLKSEGFVLGIATMKTGKQVDKLLEIFGCRDKFDIIQCAKEDGSLSKSRMLENIRRDYSGCDDFYMVGDTMGDMNAANEACFKFIFAEYGYGSVSRNECARVARLKEMKWILTTDSKI